MSAFCSAQAAATAMRKCEERLRVLHPHAMARYDRLRADGMAPADAMRETAPLFTRPPRVHDPHFTPRPPLGEEAAVVVNVEHGPGRAGFDAHTAAQAQERRGRQIIGALQEQARAYRHESPGEAEQRALLETVTNLPPEIIDRVVQPDPATCGVPEVCPACELQRCATGQRLAMMIARVPAPALSDLHAGLRLSGQSKIGSPDGPDNPA